jgi:hypothetical protein
MIWDSSPWKRDIARRADALRRRKDQKRWSEASMARVEQDIFLSAFAVRKLIESFKISDEVESRSIRAKGYKRRSGAADVMNWHRIDQLCELDNAGWRTVSLKDFCNQIIHSYMFVLRSRTLVSLVASSSRRTKRKSRTYCFLKSMRLSRYYRLWLGTISSPCP